MVYLTRMDYCKGCGRALRSNRSKATGMCALCDPKAMGSLSKRGSNHSDFVRQYNPDLEPIRAKRGGHWYVLGLRPRHRWTCPKDCLADDCQACREAHRAKGGGPK